MTSTFEPELRATLGLTAVDLFSLDAEVTGEEPRDCCLDFFRVSKEVPSLRWRDFVLGVGGSTEASLLP